MRGEPAKPQSRNLRHAPSRHLPAPHRTAIEGLRPQHQHRSPEGMPRQNEVAEQPVGEEQEEEHRAAHARLQRGLKRGSGICKTGQQTGRDFGKDRVQNRSRHFQQKEDECRVDKPCRQQQARRRAVRQAGACTHGASLTSKAAATATAT